MIVGLKLIHCDILHISLFHIFVCIIVGHWLIVFLPVSLFRLHSGLGAGSQREHLRLMGNLIGSQRHLDLEWGAISVS